MAKATKTDEFKLYESAKAIAEAGARMGSSDNLAQKMMTEYPTADDPPEYQKSYRGEVAPEVFNVLVNHRILHPNGKPVMADLSRPEGRPLGRGPLLEADAWQKLAAADTTPDHRWTEWIFDRAAGGHESKEHSRRALDQIYRRFIDERVSGFKHGDTGKWYEPVSREEAERRWSARNPHPERPGSMLPSTEMRFKRMLFQADQDQAEKLGCYGYYRSWPGGPRNYPAITAAVSKFIELMPLAEKLNKLIEQGKGMGEERVSFDPEKYANVDALNATNKRIERFFAAQAASKDVRVANDKYVYSDNFVDIIVPLTYAAAVRYGWQEWAWANKENFEKLLMGRGTSADNWKQHTKDNLIAIMRFKQPMPGWVVRQRNSFKTPTLTNLAVFIPIRDLGNLSIKDDLVFWDEENRQNLNYEAIEQIILSEPDKPENTEQDDMLPIKSWKVYKTKEEAQKILQHFNHALEQLVAWAAKFDHKTVKSDTLTLDGPVKGKVGAGQPA